MLRFIEKSFLKITQIIGLLFAALVLVVAVTIGYNKIDIKTESNSDTPVIKFSDYQKFVLAQERIISKNLKSNQRFEQIYNMRIDNVVVALEGLSNNIVEKANLKQKVIISSKVKLMPYSN